MTSLSRFARSWKARSIDDWIVLDLEGVDARKSFECPSPLVFSCPLFPENPSCLDNRTAQCF